jgi:PAS domain S-box-containing protein
MSADEGRLQNAKRWASGRRGAYAMAVVATLAAYALRSFLHPVLQEHSAFMTFLIAAFAIEYFFGLGPALLCVIGGLLLGLYYFVKPYDSFLLPEMGDLALVFGYLVISAVGIFIIELLQRSRYELQLLRDVTQSQLEALKRSQKERGVAVEEAKLFEKRYDKLASQKSELLYMRRLDGNFEYINDSFYELTGLPKGSFDFRSWSTILHPEDLNAVTEEWRDITIEGGERGTSFRVRDANGNYKLLVGMLSCVDEPRGRKIKWMGVVNGER